MELYHGTNTIIKVIDFNKSNLRTDFGKGFYLGSNLGEARKWAEGKAGFSGIPFVMRYYIDNSILHDAGVNPKRFNEPNIEWLEFVKENRHRNAPDINSPEPRHNFGAVSGPIADDRANEVVAKYVSVKFSLAKTQLKKNNACIYNNNVI